MTSAPTIIMGDVRSILQRGPAFMKNQSKWAQSDSDIIAHFLQVYAQIARSRWNRAKVSFTTQAAKLTESDFPEFEDFVYAAVYFRQLILPRDDLFNDAINRYVGFLDCPARLAWIEAERHAFKASLNGKSFPMLAAYTVRELFDAFMYGARLMHASPDPKKPNGDHFLRICDNEPRHEVLYALNISLKLLLNHVGKAAAVIHQDFGTWLTKHNLPRPNVRWHDRLFEIVDSDA